MGTLVGFPIIRVVVYWGLYWHPPIQGNFPMVRTTACQAIRLLCFRQDKRTHAGASGRMYKEMRPARRIPAVHPRV